MIKQTKESDKEIIDITNADGSITIAGESASTTNAGIIEVATGAETNTTYQLTPILTIAATLLLAYGVYHCYRKVKLIPNK